MTVTNADLDNLVCALTAAAEQARSLRRKKPDERTTADLVAVARILRPALRGLDEVASGEPTFTPVPEKPRRLKK